MPDKKRASRNRTLTITPEERSSLAARLLKIDQPATLAKIENRIIHQDLLACVDYLPDAFVDLLFVDPPYNLNKMFHSHAFKHIQPDQYEAWTEHWLTKLVRLLKPTASIYICCDWQSSPAIYNVISRHFQVRNRITWEREKGRGAKMNWKNCSEDIWFATVSNTYYFNPEAVKLKRKVIAPYKIDGQPKDWEATDDGNYRLTYPSNLWTDISVPFWSMPENTDHPTQKPEKLLAKIILASSPPNALIFDPFLGSGTTSVVAKKLGRRYVGVEREEEYCLMAEKRLRLADEDTSIQGYKDGVFWERNTLQERRSKRQQKLPSKTPRLL